MIYYFSGTGNSVAVAKAIASVTGEELCRVDWQTEAIVGDELLGFVFPIHAWGMPKVFEDFVRRLEIGHNKPHYVFLIMTCGDDTGLTYNSVFSLLKPKGISIDSAWALQMPNTYIAFPFFDIDSPELEREKIMKSQQDTAAICTSILNREKGIIKLRPGAMPYVKSHILRPLFMKLLSGDKDFSVTQSCTKCGKCSRICPVNNISMEGKQTLQWEGHCTDCLACYHFCPTRSIRKGAFSSKKGQYYFSNSAAWIKCICNSVVGK